MEFLLTYGWAIVVVVVAISALAYFGVLDPARFAPSMCTLPTGLSCLDHRITVYDAFGDKNKITLNIKNNLGSEIYLDYITFPDFGAQTYNIGNTLPNGRKTGTPGPPQIDNI